MLKRQTEQGVGRQHVQSIPYLCGRDLFFTLLGFYVRFVLVASFARWGYGWLVQAFSKQFTNWRERRPFRRRKI